MLNRYAILALSIAGLSAWSPVNRCLAQEPVTATVHAAITGDDKKEADEEKDEVKSKWKGKEEHEEIEQPVPMAMVPSAILDAVKKECPGATITEAELVVEKHKIVYEFDVKAGEMAYDVQITVDGKFYSKKVDNEKDEKDEKDEKADKKPADLKL